MKDKKVIIGIILFAVLVISIILIKSLTDNSGGEDIDLKDLTTVYVATGGGKEDFLNDEGVQKILREKYKLNVVFDTWSNGKS